MVKPIKIHHHPPPVSTEDPSNSHQCHPPKMGYHIFTAPCSDEISHPWSTHMPNSPHPPKSPWRAFIICTPPLLLLTMVIALPITVNSPNICISEIKAALIKLLLLAAFHMAPALWLTGLLKESYSNFASSIQGLRMPVAAWTAACLLIGWHLWPVLNNSPLCR